MRPPAAARKTGPALEAGYQFIVWLAPTVEEFPRSQKFSLGDRILDLDQAFAGDWGLTAAMLDRLLHHALGHPPARVASPDAV